MLSDSIWPSIRTPLFANADIYRIDVQGNVTQSVLIVEPREYYATAYVRHYHPKRHGNVSLPAPSLARPGCANTYSLELNRIVLKQVLRNLERLTRKALDLKHNNLRSTELTTSLRDSYNLRLNSEHPLSQFTQT